MLLSASHSWVMEQPLIIGYITPKIIYFCYIKDIFSGSKYPRKILFIFEYRSTGAVPSGRAVNTAWACDCDVAFGFALVSDGAASHYSSSRCRQILPGTQTHGHQGLPVQSLRPHVWYVPMSTTQSQHQWFCSCRYISQVVLKVVYFHHTYKKYCLKHRVFLRKIMDIKSLIFVPTSSCLVRADVSNADSASVILFSPSRVG